MDVGLLIASCLIASLSPGPAALSTIETSLRYGQRRAFWHTLGLAVGETPHLFLSLFGTLWLTQHFPSARFLIAAAGMTYFLYLGVTHLARPRSSLPEGAALEAGAWRLFFRGAWVNFSNPKTIPWMIVIIQAANVPSDRFAWSTTGVFLLCTLGSEISVMSFYAMVGDRLRMRLKDAATIRWVDRATGVLWTALGVLMARQAYQLLEVLR
ncbi:MAG: LysE family translocator [Opitutales bacterium]|jgi:homoserine/homoserine lactone efflux protein|nr:LysE family translocator [Opitutales bacterium]